MRGATVVVWLAACSYHGRELGGDAGGADAANGIPDAASTWWDPAWPTRLPLTIDNLAAVDLPAGYQVGFPYAIDGGPCAGPRDNLRVVRGGAELDRVIDEVPGDEWIWLALVVPIAPAASSQDYWLYCGNPAPPAAPADPAVVFVFHDDFDRGALGASWQTQSDVTMTGTSVSLGGNDSGIITNLTFGPGHAIDYVVRPTNPGLANFWAGFQNGFPDQPPWLHWWTMNSYEVRPDYWASQSGAQWYGTGIYLDNAYHLYGVENYGDRSAYRYEGPIVEEHLYDLAPDPPVLNARLHNNTFSSYAEYDWVRVRRAVHPQPSVTVGAPESGP